MAGKAHMTSSPYTYRDGLRDGVPIGLGYLSVSFGFGIAAVSAGLSPLVALIISLANETSAGQLAGLTIIITAGTLIEMALTQFIINIRYSLMAISLSQRLDRSFTTPWRMLLSFCITDEIFAVASTKRHRIGARYFAGLSAVPYLGWGLGTLLGALAGTFLPPTIRDALSLMLYGMFLAIVIPPARRERGVLFAVLSAVGLSCFFRYTPGVNTYISEGFALIISAVISSVLAALLFPMAESPSEERRHAPRASDESLTPAKADPPAPPSVERQPAEAQPVEAEPAEAQPAETPPLENAPAEEVTV